VWGGMSISAESPAELIKISQKDFEASKILFEKGLYQQALVYVTTIS